MLIFFIVILETKKLFVHFLFTCLIYGNSYYSLNMIFLLVDFNVCKTLRVHILVKVQAFLTQLFQKRTLTGIFEGFNLNVKQFFLYL